MEPQARNQTWTVQCTLYSIQHAHRKFVLVSSVENAYRYRESVLNEPKILQTYHNRGGIFIPFSSQSINLFLKSLKMTSQCHWGELKVKISWWFYRTSSSNVYLRTLPNYFLILRICYPRKVVGEGEICRTLKYPRLLSQLCPKVFLTIFAW
jgi:hypothetical protein